MQYFENEIDVKRINGHHAEKPDVNGTVSKSIRYRPVMDRLMSAFIKPI
jgi:hypothetical protein